MIFGSGPPEYDQGHLKLSVTDSGWPPHFKT